MEENKTTAVVMTEEERAEFEAYKAAQEKKKREAAAKAERETYAAMVDDEIARAIPGLKEISCSIRQAKEKVFDSFQAILDLKGEMFRNRKGKEMSFASHTFTNSEGTMRIVLGQYLNDNYRDTAEDGIAMIQDYLSSLAIDEKTQALVSMVMKLLAKDAKGTLKAQRILQLRKIAEDSGSEEFIEGVRIIEEAYNPTPSRTFLRAEERDEKTNAWKPIPLGMTEA